MTTTTPRPTTVVVEPVSDPRRWLADLGLGVRLATRTDTAGLLRLLLTAVGIGLSVAVLLLAASVDRGLDNRQTRADSLTATIPTADPPASAGLFEAHTYTQTYHGQLVTGTDVAALSPDAPPPPGLSSFPAPGTLALSPALADLLHSPDGDALRPRLTGPVSAVIDDAGLVSPSELRFVRGFAPPYASDPTLTVPASVATSQTWGRSDDMTYPDNRMVPDLTRAATVLGAAVILVPLLIFVSLMARLGTATRGRRTAALQAIGATGPQLSRILAGETLLGSIAGLALGALGFLALRQSGWIIINGSGFFPSDLTPQPQLAALIAILVPVIATVAAIIRTPAGFTGSPLGPDRSRRRSNWLRLVFGIVVGMFLIIQISFGDDLFSDARLAILAGTVLLVLLLVPVLLPPLLTWGIRLVPTRRVVWLLAARRLQSDTGSASRSVAGLSVVVAAAVAVASILSLTDDVMATGYHADQDPTQYRIQIDAASATEIAALTIDLRALPGVEDVAGGSYVWMTTGDPMNSFEVFIADCAQIAATMGIADCVDGDVLHVPAYGTGETIAEGTELHVAMIPAPASSYWTIPAGSLRSIEPAGPDPIFAPALVVTPAALGAALGPVLGSSFAFFTVDTSRTDALDDIRNAAGSFGYRALATSRTEWAADSGTIQLTTTLQTGLILGGSIIVLVALLGLLVVAIEQLTARRRALTLTVAAGVPRSMIARSLLAGSFITGTIGAILGSLVGVLLATYISNSVGTPAAIPIATILVAALCAVVVTVAATAATLPALRSVTHLDTLRTN